MAQLRAHELRAKSFFYILKYDNVAMATFSFDCQKNMPLPKILDQATYYSRQIYIYNFTIIHGTSKTKLTKDNAFSYTWSELEYPKCSCEISSAVYQRLINTHFSEELLIVTLFSPN